MKSILDRGFVYTNAASTDIRKTFERIRREQERQYLILAADAVNKAADVLKADNDREQPK